MTSSKDITSAIPVEVNSIDDLIRWIISNSDNQHGTLFYFVKNEKHILSSYLSLKNYYEQRGLPIFAYITLKKRPEKFFLKYDLRDDIDNTERLKFTTGFDENDSNLGFIQYLPIIELKRMPDFFNISP